MQAVVSAAPVSKIEETFDAEKVNLKSLVVNQVKRFVAIDLPELRERWYKAIESDQGKTQLSKETREAARLYIEAVKVSMDVMPKLNIKVELKENVTQVENQDSTKSKEDSYNKLARILLKRGYVITRPSYLSSPTSE